MLNQVLRTFCYLASLTVMVCLVALVWLATGCQVFRPSKVAEITAEHCVAIAEAQCRYDIAEACKIVHDLAPLLDLLAKSPENIGYCK